MAVIVPRLKETTDEEVHKLDLCGGDVTCFSVKVWKHYRKMSHLLFVRLSEVLSGDAPRPLPAEVHGPQGVGDVCTLHNDPLHDLPRLLVLLGQTDG